MLISREGHLLDINRVVVVVESSTITTITEFMRDLPQQNTVVLR